MRSKAILVVMVAVMLVTGTAQANFVLTDAEHMDITSEHSTGVLWDFSSVDLLSGGYVNSLDAYDSTAVNLSGGNINILNAWNSATVNILPGALTNGPVRMQDNSSLVMSGGSFNGNLVALDTSSVIITGGNFLHDLNATYTYLVVGGSSTLNISGGYVNQITTSEFSTVDMSGGSVGKIVASGAGSIIRFHGYDFTSGEGTISFDGDMVLGSGQLLGKWFDGTSWSLHIDDHAAGTTILAVPEPCSLVLLTLGAVMVKRKR